MIRTILWLVQVIVVVPAVYSSTIALFGLRGPSRKQEPSLPSVRMRIVIPAHNEGAVIEGIAQDLAAQLYPASLFEAVVIADRTTDNTCDIAAKYMRVVSRSDGVAAKGAALAWYLDSEPLAYDEVLLVLDADNRIDTGYVASVAESFEEGVDVVQTYLDVVNPEASPLATANALTYWASNRMVQLSRSNIGWSCDLGGTGMAMTAAALEAAGGFSDDLADDLSLNIRLNLAGYRTRWVHDARVRDEKPAGTSVTVSQRARWVRGRRAVGRRHGWELISAGFRRRDPNLLDLAYRLFHPGRSFLALILGLLAVASVIWPTLGLWSPFILGSLAMVVVFLPIVFLAREQVPAHLILKYPFVVLIAVLWLPIRVVSRFMSGWNRTPHSGS